ncbi:hypothetical protein U1839_04385 [Sphingomonas sp. RT2P30]|uniref:hypothetical protein n=1 Tax=Parasphingomonas halimpatiens TaxID=3096162 RepID=UPI002FCC06CE
MIRTLRGLVDSGVDQAAALRDLQIKVDGSFSAAKAMDGYMRWTGCAYDNYGRPHGGGVLAWAQADAAYYRERFGDPTFAALSEPYREIADLWTYFDQPLPIAAPGAAARTDPVEMAINSETRTAMMGPWGGNGARLVTGDQGDYTRDEDAQAIFFDHPAPPGEHVTHLTMSGTSGITLTFSNGDKREAGLVGATPKVEIVLGAGQAVVGMFGAWDKAFKSLQFRTNFPLDGAYDHGNHLGGDAGEGDFPFATNGPDGSDAVLSGVFGFLLDRDPGISALGCYWTYSRALPRNGWTDVPSAVVPTTDP